MVICINANKIGKLTMRTSLHGVSLHAWGGGGGGSEIAVRDLVRQERY